MTALEPLTALAQRPEFGEPGTASNPHVMTRSFRPAATTQSFRTAAAVRRLRTAATSVEVAAC